MKLTVITINLYSERIPDSTAEAVSNEFLQQCETLAKQTAESLGHKHGVKLEVSSEEL